MEIKPQDLRVGNKLNCVDGYIGTVSEIKHGRCMLVKEQRGTTLIEYSFGYDELSGIELTPEWLTRFGFKRTQIYENVDEWYKKPLSLQTDQEIFMVTRIGTDDLELKHVHQLQNLFYSLTGEELAIDKTSLKN